MSHYNSPEFVAQVGMDYAYSAVRARKPAHREHWQYMVRLMADTLIRERTPRAKLDGLLIGGGYASHMGRGAIADGLRKMRARIREDRVAGLYRPMMPTLRTTRDGFHIRTYRAWDGYGYETRSVHVR